MTQLRSDRALEQADIARFLSEQSDFAFEVRALQVLTESGFTCQHGWTYRDPVTGKTHQFDIRAERMQHAVTINLAVECKNLKTSRPLLVHALPRENSEAFHCVIARPDIPYAATRTRRVDNGSSCYESGAAVGKQTDQPAIKSDGSFLNADADVFDKVSQAINSAFGMVQAAYTAMPVHHLTTVVPVLVVPDGTLWQVDYDLNGVTVVPPRQVATASLYLSVTWDIQQLHTGGSFTVSHLEILTLSSIPQRVDEWLGERGLFQNAGHLLRP